jgi:hypothetical protein
MADPQGLDVHDIMMTSNPTFDNRGQMMSNTMVSFMVGNHGPFTLTYGPGEFTPDRANGDIEKQVRDIRAVVMRP